MKKINLNDGTSIYCLKQNEAIVLDEHIKGYLSYGFKINNGDTIIDVGANIGVLGIRLSQNLQNINIYAFEPIPDIYNVLEKNSKGFLVAKVFGVTSPNTRTRIVIKSVA